MMKKIAIIENTDCPMLYKNIDIAYCIELRMIVDGEVTPTEEERHLTAKDHEKCKLCHMRRIMKD